MMTILGSLLTFAITAAMYRRIAILKGQVETREITMTAMAETIEQQADQIASLKARIDQLDHDYEGDDPDDDLDLSYLDDLDDFEDLDDDEDEYDGEDFDEEDLGDLGDDDEEHDEDFYSEDGEVSPARVLELLDKPQQYRIVRMKPAEYSEWLARNPDLPFLDPTANTTVDTETLAPRVT